MTRINRAAAFRNKIDDARARWLNDGTHDAGRAAGRNGLLELTDMPVMPFDALRAVFDDLHASSERGNAPCYPRGLALKVSYRYRKVRSGTREIYVRSASDRS